MKRPVFLRSAKKDLVDIHTYIAMASDSVPRANRFVDDLRLRCLKIARIPGMVGRARTELGDDLRSIAHKGYVVVFRYAGTRIEIVRIVEGHRDLPAVVTRDD